ncbi:MAG: hypothetical protein AB7V26_03250 [Lysobacterales bacterium]
MTPPFRDIYWLLRNQVRLSWRQQQSLSGSTGALISPLLLVSVYVVINIFYLLLHLSSVPSAGSSQLSHTFAGWALTGTFIILTISAFVPTADMVRGRGDWELIVGSPFPLSTIVVLRLLIIWMHAMALPVLFLSPAMNVRILSGEPSFLQFYPALAALGLSAVGLAALLTLCMPAKMDLTRTKTILKMAGLVILGAVVVASLLGGDIRALKSQLAFVENSSLFALANWLGTGMFTGFLPLAALSMIGVAAFTVALGPIQSRILKSVQAEGTLSSAKVLQRQLTFSNRLCVAVMKKEWRLARRDKRFFLDLIREVIVVLTIFILAVDEAKGGFINSGAVLTVALSSVMANDLSWRMAAVEQLPELIYSAPIRVTRIVVCKLVAANITPLVVLFIAVICVGFFAPQLAALTLLSGLGSISGSSLINYRPHLVDGKTNGSHVSQPAVVVIIQAANVFSWSLALYWTLTGMYALAGVALITGIALPLGHFLFKNR